MKPATVVCLAALAAVAIALPVSADEGGKPAAPAGKVKDGVQHVDAAGARAVIDGAAKDKAAKVIVLDVRSPEEFKEGHIKGAVNIDFNGKDFAAAAAKLDKDATVVVHCQAGGRSARSLPKLKELGFKKLVHLDGGFGGWEAAGLPVEKP